MTATAAPAGAPCWIDLMSSDTARSQDFYGQLLGWTAGEGSPEFGGYFMFERDGVPVAGGMPTPEGLDAPDEWGVYLAVEDARKTTEVALARGAGIRAEPIDVADLGTMAIVIDPTGADIGMWQAGTFAGFGVQAGAGTPGWFELHTREYPAAVAFYRDVFGWDPHTVSDTPEFRLATLGADDQARAGIMDASSYLPEAASATWLVYFTVDDADAALATVTRLGGAVVEGAKDTPYGRLAAATDPTGATFKLIGPNQATAAG